MLPGGERLAWKAASRYVAGRTRAEALVAAVGLLGSGHAVSLELLTAPRAGQDRSGQDHRTPDHHGAHHGGADHGAHHGGADHGAHDGGAGHGADHSARDGGTDDGRADDGRADDIAREYLTLAGVLAVLPPGAWLSADPARLGVGADPEGAAERVAEIVEALPRGARLQLGAPHPADVNATLRWLTRLEEHAGRLGATLPADQLRSPGDLEHLADLGLHVRLLKGAPGERTDLAFLRLAHRLAERRVPWSMATHDARLREAILMHLGTVEVELPFGVHPEQLGELQARAVPTRVHVPFGPGWMRYWLNRDT